MGVPISNVTRRVVYTASGTGPYNFTFEILAAGDVAVYRDDTLLTITTDYTVTINANGTGFITLVASPTGATQIAIVGNRTIQRTTDFVTGGDFFANTVNDEMDQQTIFAQQNAEGLQRALQAPQTDPTTIDMTLPRAAIRASKVLSFDANGNPSATEFIGSNRGNWASGTLYYVRDIIKDTSTSNIWQCVVEHTSTGSQPIGTNADAAKWFLLVDAAAAGASATAAAASASAAATSASNASTSATNAASSASTASTQASNASTSATNAANSATAAASSASTASTAATNAGNSATAAATSATNASNSASSASTSATNASNSATSAASSASTATTQASNAASSASAASTSASNASTSATNAANSATNSASSATAAAASAAAAAASFDAFDDIYLGAKSSDPTVDNDGNALTVGDQYFNTTANELRVYNGSTWQAASTVGGTVTSLSVTGATTLGQNPTLSAGTANGVAYLNGSKVLTTGSALTFDGTRLGVGTASPGAKLTVSDASTGALIRVSSDTNGSNRGVEWHNSATANIFGSIVSNYTNGILTYDSGGSAYAGSQAWSLGTGGEQMRLTSTGLGIGTSSPSAKLEVASDVESTALRVTTASNQNYQLRLGFRTASLTGEIQAIHVGTAYRDIVLQRDGGNLGLGVTPSAWATYPALQLAGGGVMGAGSELNLSANAYFNAGWKRIAIGAATLYNQAAGVHSWYNAVSSSAGSAISLTQAMTLDASGNLGIGTTSAGGFTKTIRLNTASGTAGMLLCDADTDRAGFYIDAGTTAPAYLFTNNSKPLVFSVAGAERARITSGGSLQIGATTGAGARVFIYDNRSNSANADEAALCVREDGTNAIQTWLGGGGAERARIDSSGNLLLATTTQDSGARFTLNDQGVVGISMVETGTASHGRIYFKNGNGVVGQISTNGSATTYSTSSDYRLKENIQPMTGALAKVAALKPCTYKWKADGSDGEGFIAHELQAVCPDAVTGEKDAVDADGNPQYQGIDTSFLVATLTAAIQELKAEFDAYKATHP